MNKASLKKLLKTKAILETSSEKEELLNTICDNFRKIGVLTIGVSYSENDNLEFLKMYSDITKNRAELLKRAIFNKERKGHFAQLEIQD